MSSITEQVGRVVGGRYRLLTPIGSGASSQVFGAVDTRLGRRVAVKVLRPSLASDDSFLKRFRAEARLAASLDHPHIMRVFDWGEESAGPYLVLELLSGGSLRSMLDVAGRLSHAQVAMFGSQAASGLAYAHRRGIIHRDIKPGNLLFDDEGHVRIADFGVARAIAQAALTEPLGMMFGTARYASPEQARGGTLDERTDVYSLALVLYEALTGHVPFSADTVSGTLMGRIGATLPPARELGPLAPILAAAAIPEPLARLGAVGLANELEQLGRHLPPADALPVMSAPPEHGTILFDSDATDVDPAQGGRGLTSVIPVVPFPITPLDEPPPEEQTQARQLLVPHAAQAPSPSLYPPQGPATSAAPPPTPPSFATPTSLSAPAPAAPTRRSRRRRLALLAASLLVVLALVAAGTIAGVVHYVVYGHVVPAFTGKPFATAEALAHKAGLQLELGSERYSMGVPAGDVASQSLPPGRHVKAGAAIVVVESKGAPPVPVPNVQDWPQRAARSAIESGHLVPVVKLQYSETVRPGLVIDQSPMPSTHDIARGSKVVLFVSKGPKPRIVPNVYDVPLAEAEQALGNVQLRYSVASGGKYSMTVPEGYVIGESPAAHQSVRRYSIVVLTLSLGKPFVTVPQLYGLTVPQAEAKLQAEGLTWKVYGPRKGVVVYSAPGPGQSVRSGTTVTLAAV